MIVTVAPAVGDPVTLIRDNLTTGYAILPETSWGDSVWDVAYSGARGTQGARAASGAPQNRPVSLVLSVTGTSKDNLHDRMGVVYDLGQRLRRHGGRITVKGNGQTYRQHFEVMGGTASVKEWGLRAENLWRSGMILEAVCAPYLEGDPFDAVDTFATRNLVTNPTIEIDTTGIVDASYGATGVTFARTARVIAGGQGAYALRHAATLSAGATWAEFATDLSSSGVTPGDVFTLTGVVDAVALPAGTTVYARLHWNGPDTYDTTAVYTGTGVKSFSLTAAAPAGTFGVSVSCTAVGTGAVDVYWDAITLRRGSGIDDVDTLLGGDWTFDAGVRSSDVAVVGGELQPTGVFTTERRMIHTLHGHTIADDGAIVTGIAGATITSQKFGVVLNRMSSGTYLEAYVDDNATNSRLRIDTVIGGVRTNGVTTNLGARMASGNDYTVEAYRMGARVTANVWSVGAGGALRTPKGTPLATVSYTLSLINARDYYSGGQAGLSWTPQAVGSRIIEWRRAPLRLAGNAFRRIPVGARIPGDTAALADVAVTTSGDSAAPAFGLLAFAERPRPHSYVGNGHFEVDTDGWQTGASSGLTAAATSITRVAGGKYGAFCAQVVTAATANSGVSFAIRRRFYAGVTYTAEMYASRSGAASARIGLGQGNPVSDYAASTYTSLGTTWTRYSITWTPTADRDVAYVFIGNDATATANTFWIDGVLVYEGTTPPTIARQSEGAGALPPFEQISAAQYSPTSDLTGWVASTLKLTVTLASQSFAGTASYWIDPALLTPDDYTLGEIDVEVWGEVQLASALVSPKLTISARPEAGTTFGAERFTAEYGTAGKLLTKPSSSTVIRLMRLGTLTLPTETVDGGAPRWKLWLAGSCAAASTGDFEVHSLTLIPTRGRAATPTGKANDTTYPKFLATTSQATKTITSDLRGRVASPPNPPIGDHGLGQALLEPPQGNTDLLAMICSTVPDDPTANTSTNVVAAAPVIRLSLTPRWHLFRGS